MAYMDQDKKRVIAAAVKAVMPQGWKYSLAVRDYQVIVCTIRRAPFDLMAALAKSEFGRTDHRDLNPYYIREEFDDECVADVFERIVSALNTGNHDRSDSQRDHFDIGHYVNIKIGDWDKPFIYAPDPSPALSRS